MLQRSAIHPSVCNNNVDKISLPIKEKEKKPILQSNKQAVQ